MAELKENNANRGKKAHYTYASSKRTDGEYSRTETKCIKMEFYNKPLGRSSETIKAIRFSL